MTEPGTVGGDPANSIVDLLDRVVHRGAVINGDVVIALADVDLIRLDLRLLLTGIDDALRALPTPSATGNAL